jgi:hypothetical protein
MMVARSCARDSASSGAKIHVSLRWGNSMIGGIEKLQAACVRIRCGVAALALAALMAACGNDSSMSGEYVGQPGAWVDKLVFGPGNEVRAIDNGKTSAGVFRIEGSEIFLTFGTDQDKLSIGGNGCLSSRLGTYCKR